MGKPSVSDLRELVRAPVITADDPGYDGARAVWNAMFDKRPLAIVRAEQVADVIGAVNFARDGGLDLSIRGGGHSAPGFGTNDAGVVIDLSLMRHVHVDPQARDGQAGWRACGAGDRRQATGDSHNPAMNKAAANVSRAPKGPSPVAGRVEGRDGGAGGSVPGAALGTIL